MFCDNCGELETIEGQLLCWRCRENVSLRSERDLYRRHHKEFLSELADILGATLDENDTVVNMELRIAGLVRTMHHNVVDLHNELALMTANAEKERLEKEKLQAIVKQLEWQPVEIGAEPECPFCEKHKVFGHTEDCRIGNVIDSMEK